MTLTADGTRCWSNQRNTGSWLRLCKSVGKASRTDPQPTLWNTFRWQLQLEGEAYARLKGLAGRIRTLAESDPNRDQLISEKLKPARPQAAPEGKMGVPDLSALRFSTRCLVEGLIAHGILTPECTQELLDALKLHAIASSFQDRILESMYNEDRIRNVTALVRGKCYHIRN
jgi:RNA-dependent RNA polymerase